MKLSKKSYINEKRPSKETYTTEKRRVKEKRDRKETEKRRVKEAYTYDARDINRMRLCMN